MKKRHMVSKAANYELTVGKLYNLALDEIPQRCVLDHGRDEVLWISIKGLQQVMSEGNTSQGKYYIKKCDVC